MVVDSYVIFSRDDPHYIEFLRMYLRSSDVRFLLDNAVREIYQYFDHEVRKLISNVFCVRIDSILILDIRAIHKQVNEDLRRIAERLTDADLG